MSSGSVLPSIIMYVRPVSVGKCDNHLYIFASTSFFVMCTFHRVFIHSAARERLGHLLYFSTHLYVFPRLYISKSRNSGHKLVYLYQTVFYNESFCMNFPKHVRGFQLPRPGPDAQHFSFSKIRTPVAGLGCQHGRFPHSSLTTNDIKAFFDVKCLLQPVVHFRMEFLFPHLRAVAGSSPPWPVLPPALPL